MSRTHETHLSPSKRAKRGGKKPPQPKVRSPYVAAMIERGSQTFGKSRKQQRQADKAALRKELSHE